MAENLQHLLEHIKSKGIDEAREESEKILAHAREESETLREEARHEIEAWRENAEKDAKAFEQRAADSIRQAARDVIRSIDEALQRKITGILNGEISKALDEEQVQELIVQAVSRYLDAEGESAEAEVLLNPEQLEKIQSHLLEGLKRSLDEHGVELAPEDTLAAGFKLRVDQGRVEYDFSEKAIAEAMGRLLRPGLAELLQPQDRE